MRRASFTLIEIVVVVAIFSIVGLVLANYTRAGYNIYLRAQITGGLHDESNALATRLSNALRGTFVVTSATQDSLTVQSYFAPNDATPTLVTITRNSNSIVLSTTRGVALAGGGFQYNPASTLTRTISSHFVATANPPLFRYYNESTTLLSAPIDLASVHLIEITATVFSPLQNTKTAVATTRVELRNLKTNL